jgi:hypothetical protein
MGSTMSTMKVERDLGDGSGSSSQSLSCPSYPQLKFVERVRSNNQGSREKHFNKKQAVEAFTDPFTWLLFFLAVFNTLVVGGLGTFNNLLINQAFGFDVLTSQLLGIPLSVCAVCFYLLFA